MGWRKKKQLIETIESKFPDEIRSSRKIEKYFEPFVGGGALFFYLMSNYHIGEAYIYDINRELILTYDAIKYNPNELIEELKILSDEYIPKGQDGRKEMYLDIRQKFNEAIPCFDFENYNEEYIQRGRLYHFYE